MVPTRRWQPTIRLLLPFLLLSCLAPSWAQEDEMKVIERVAELQRQLADPQVPVRDDAERQLLEIGIPALDYLDPLPPEATEDTRERYHRIRRQLETLAVSAVSGPSRVTLQGGFTWPEMLESIKRQTGNDVQLGPGAASEQAGQQLELNLTDVTFWQALEEICRRGKLRLDPYRSSSRTLRLVRIGESGQPAPSPPPTVSASIFQATVVQVISSRHLENPQLNYTNVRLRLRWEPRLTPISLSVPGSSLVARDDRGQACKASNPQAVFSATVLPEIPEVEFNLPLSPAPRESQQLDSLSLELKAVIPGRQETFRFQKLGRLQPGTSQTKAGVVVGFEGIRENEDLFGVTLSLAFEDEHQALESHFSWITENPLVLIDREGRRWAPLAQETLGQTNVQARMQYYFDRDPSGMDLEYRTPAAIVAIPVKIELRGIPLP